MIFKKTFFKYYKNYIKNIIINSTIHIRKQSNNIYFYYIFLKIRENK